MKSAKKKADNVEAQITCCPDLKDTMWSCFDPLQLYTPSEGTDPKPGPLHRMARSSRPAPALSLRRRVRRGRASSGSLERGRRPEATKDTPEGA